MAWDDSSESTDVGTPPLDGWAHLEFTRKNIELTSVRTFLPSMPRRPYNPQHTLALTPDTRLGVYEVIAQIGEAGADTEHAVPNRPASVVVHTGWQTAGLGDSFVAEKSREWIAKLGATV